MIHLPPNLTCMKQILLSASLFIASVNSFAQWNNNPSVNNLVSKENGEDYYPCPVSDAAGGSIIFFKNNNYIYVQKITSSGNIAWGDSTHPVPVSTAGSTYLHTAIPDGSGGAFVAWEDFRSSSSRQVYVQHINNSGITLWINNGIKVADNITYGNNGPILCTDGAGGIFVEWITDNGFSIYQGMIQRINGVGSILFGAGGIQVMTGAGLRFGGNMVSDGNHGAIIFLSDTRNDPHGLDYWDYAGHDPSNIDIYGQRIDSAGNRLWTNNGVTVSTAGGNQGEYSYNWAVTDGSGGAVIAFSDTRNFTGLPSRRDIYVQRLNAAGVNLWTQNGVAVSDNLSSRDLSSVTTDQNGGIVICWMQTVQDQIVHAQRINSTGLAEWGANGAAVISSLSPSSPVVTGDSLGNYLFAFSCYDNLNHWAIRAQKLNTAGALQWGITGVPVCSYPAWPTQPAVCTSGNGAIVVWIDSRAQGPTYGDLYSSRVLATGSLASGLVSYTTIANGNWNDPAIWSSGLVPSATSVVVINNAVTVSANAVCYSLTTNSPGAVTVNAGIVLTVLH